MSEPSPRPSQRTARADSPDAADKPYVAPLAYLRAFIIVLVVAHHAAMAYHVILPPFEPSSLREHLQSIRAVSPVNDERQSALLSLFAAFNDLFFMALLFLLSGLFVWDSLRRKGRLIYLRERLLRLGVPLVIMVALRPLSYYPTYLQNGGTGGLADFWREWSAIDWRGGPAWFLEVLLLFDVFLVLATSVRVGERGTSWFAARSWEVLRRPVRLFALLVLVSAVAYVPMTLAYGTFTWVQVGPAQIQINRLLLYLVYFLSGVALGAHGIGGTSLAPDSALPRRWVAWAVVALASFALSVGTSLGGANKVLVALLDTLSCAAISFAFLAVFLRFAQTRRAVFDSLFRSSYGIYVLHYGIVSWLGYALVGLDVPALVKWAVVFPAALALCWGATALARRVPGVARVI